MVKPITRETLFMNVMELDFPSNIELEHWLETFQERIWTEALMAEFKAGLIRVTVPKFEIKKITLQEFLNTSLRKLIKSVKK